MNTGLEENKILAITDEKGRTMEFATEAESEVVSKKLKYYMWLSRLFIFTSTLTLVFFMCSSLVIFRLSPQVTVEPFLIINQDSSARMVRYEPITQDMASKNKLMELFLKQYVILRHTIINDPIEMRTRWSAGGMINFLSSPWVFNEFAYKSPEAQAQVIERGMSREVEIISIGKVGINEQSMVWKVDFKTYDLSESDRSSTGGLRLTTTYWTASITAQFIPYRMFISRRLINPLGFTVTRYSETQVNVY